MALIAGLVLFALLDPPLGAIFLALGAVIEIGEAIFWTRYLKRIRVRTGAEGMIGERAQVSEDCRPSGKVRVHGEIWDATCPRGASAGEAVRVVSVDRLTLTVEPDPEAPAV